MQGFNPGADTTLYSNDGTSTPTRTPNMNGNRWSGVKDMDAAEEAYFNTSDDEDDHEASPKTKRLRSSPRDNILSNGVTSSPMLKSLVDYPDDEDDLMDTDPPHRHGSASSSAPDTPSTSTEGTPKLSPSPMLQTPPPERFSEKRRREEDNDEDELGKLTTTKRRNSGSSVSSLGSNTSNTLKRKKGFFTKKDTAEATGDVKVKKIEISLGAKSAASEQSSKADDGG